MSHGVSVYSVVARKARWQDHKMNGHAMFIVRKQMSGLLACHLFIPLYTLKVGEASQEIP